ncbi:O-glycoside alpha-1,2-mannosyltransferase 4 [Neolecta irregularis DAH-3]|uniref:O-glycoside alpha-1,2-mannosyltransferase 4 n=1 Tax=Neolecta irregularis (strain DAH-3) TaxID=1198029 RepID=A0A1U7LKY4_NEOID|nr:O-glycoside alpha-1,2-mannosyltransferase 4 [Neolecta irregularis DAH-3]|eukprot:OLL23298.1 O-glycoside alpha-1,2-mannosyltransferase 4 [Neolecta irregularis DAH-3]
MLELRLSLLSFLSKTCRSGMMSNSALNLMLLSYLRLPPQRFAFPAIISSLCFVLTVLFLRLYPSDDLQYSRINTDIDAPFISGCQDPIAAAKAHPREKAAIVMLARNSEFSGILRSIESIEQRFNRYFNYPYVLLNDKKFNSTIRAAVRNATSSLVEFGQIPEAVWNFPSWTNRSLVQEAIALQGDRSILYGGMESYHKMCRFYSGFFYKHELLAKYEWYWRLEPDVSFYCDITYDPFVYMAKHNKVYGFNIAVKESSETVPSLFRYVTYYKRKHNIQSKGLWEMFITEESKHGSHNDDFEAMEAMEGESYNLCHFWSNFEIARLDFFRSPEYEALFNTIEDSGGFWNERFGDAPIHSLATGLFLSPSQLHYFRDIGYRHSDIPHCPANTPGKQLPRPPVPPGSNHNAEPWDKPRKGGVGCRCQCPIDLPEIEVTSGSCINQWVDVIGGWV